MLKTTFFKSRIIASALIVAFVVLLTPVPNFAQGPSQAGGKQGTLQGTLFSEGGGARISNAIIKIRNLNNQKEYISLPTDANGGFKILGIEEGWYTLGATTPAGDFNLNYGVYIKAGETAKLSLEMQPGGMLEGKGGNGGGGKNGFFSTPGGILLLVALAGGAGIGVYELVREKSPIY